MTVSRVHPGFKEVLGATTVKCDVRGKGAWFDIPLGKGISAADLLAETIEVKAENQNGTTGSLRMDGASQMELIKEVLSRPADTLLSIDFTTGGNSGEYIKSSFSGAEKEVRWALGGRSVIVIPAPETDGRYFLRMRVLPFGNQVLTVFANDFEIGNLAFSGWHVRFLEFEIPFSAIKGRAEIQLRFDHPEGAVPRDTSKSGDTRELAIAFKRMTLVRLRTIE